MNIKEVIKKADIIFLTFFLLFPSIIFAADSVQYEKQKLDFFNISLRVEFKNAPVHNYAPGDTLHIDAHVDNLGSNCLIDGTLVYNLVAGSSTPAVAPNSPTVRIDSENLIGESVIPVTSCPTKPAVVPLTVNLPKDLRAGDYRIDIYLRSPRLPVNGRHETYNPSVYLPFKVSGTGSFPSSKIVRSKTAFAGAGYQTGPIVESGSTQTSYVTLIDQDKIEAFRGKLVTSICNFDELAGLGCREVSSRDVSLEPGIPKTLRTELNINFPADAYSVTYRLVGNDGRVNSIYNNVFIVKGHQASIRAMSMNKLSYSKGDRVIVQADINGAYTQNESSASASNISFKAEVFDRSGTFEKRIFSKTISYPSITANSELPFNELFIAADNVAGYRLCGTLSQGWNTLEQRCISVGADKHIFPWSVVNIGLVALAILLLFVIWRLYGLRRSKMGAGHIIIILALISAASNILYSREVARAQVMGVADKFQSNVDHFGDVCANVTFYIDKNGDNKPQLSEKINPFRGGDDSSIFYLPKGTIAYLYRPIWDDPTATITYIQPNTTVSAAVADQTIIPSGIYKGKSFLQRLKDVSSAFGGGGSVSYRQSVFGLPGVDPDIRWNQYSVSPYGPDDTKSAPATYATFPDGSTISGRGAVYKGSFNAPAADCVDAVTGTVSGTEYADSGNCYNTYTPGGGSVVIPDTKTHVLTTDPGIPTPTVSSPPATPPTVTETQLSNLCTTVQYGSCPNGAPVGFAYRPYQLMDVVKVSTDTSGSAAPVTYTPVTSYGISITSQKVLDAINHNTYTSDNPSSTSHAAIFPAMATADIPAATVNGINSSGSSGDLDSLIATGAFSNYKIRCESTNPQANAGGGKASRLAADQDKFDLVKPETASLFSALNSLLDVKTALAASCISPPSGIVSWWRAENNSPNDYYSISNGTFVNGPSYASGQVGQAFNLNGTTQYIDAGNANGLKVKTGTIEAWIKTSASDTSNNWHGIIVKQNGYSMFMKSNNLAFYDWQTGVTGWVVNPILANGQWHHVAITFQNGVSVAMYIDGVSGSVTNWATGAPVSSYSVKDETATNLTIGDGGPTSNQYFQGLIDEPAVYNRVLSAAEIQSIYNAGISGKCAALYIMTTSLANANVNAATSYTIAATGGTTPYTFSISSVPPGMAFNTSTGVLNGTPNTLGTYNFTIQVTDSVGGTASQALTLNVVAGPCSPNPIAFGQTISGKTLTTGSCPNAPSSPYYGDLYSFSAPAGQGITITITRTSGTDYSQVRLYRASPLTLLGSSPSGNPTATLNYTTPASPANDNYVIYAVSYNAVVPLGYNITLSPQPPPSPTSLSATPGNAQISLNWTASTGLVTGYKVYRGNAAGFALGSPIGTPTGTSYTDTTAVNGTTYYYKVTATNSAGDSASASNEVSAVPVGPPPAPSKPGGTASANQILLSWPTVPSATGYKVYRNTTGAPAADTDLITCNVAPAATVTGAVTTSSSNGEEVYSFTGNGTFSPSVDTNVQVLVVAGGGAGAAWTGAGGGAGGVIYNSSFAVTAASSPYTITVGAGAPGGQTTNPATGVAWANGSQSPSGSNSTFSTLTAIGGGGGGTNTAAGKPGGSGGGGGYNPTLPAVSGGAGTAGQGNNGGNGVTGNPGSVGPNYGSGGGGGAGSAGAYGTGTIGGNGGSGYTTSISGSSVTYGGGGGGGTYGGGTPGNGGSGGGGVGGTGKASLGTGPGPGNGVANTGGGGGGQRDNLTTSGGSGGSGIVIIRYPSCADTNVVGGTDYYYSIKASNAGGDSTFSVLSNKITAILTIPSAPNPAPVATAGNGQATITWTSVPSATSYRLYSSAVNNFGTQVGSDIIGTSVTTPLTNGNSYTFKISAFNSAGEGTKSSVSNSVTPQFAPNPPTGVTGTPGDGKVVVSWTAPGTDSSHGAPTDYIVYYSSDNFTTTNRVDINSSQNLPVNTFATIVNLQNGTPYTFKVASFNAVGGEGAPAVSAPITPVDPCTVATSLPYGQTANGALTNLSCSKISFVGQTGHYSDTYGPFSVAAGQQITITMNNTNTPVTTYPAISMYDASVDPVANPSSSIFTWNPGTNPAYKVYLAPSSPAANSYKIVATDATAGGLFNYSISVTTPGVIAPDVPYLSSVLQNGPGAIQVTWAAPSYNGTTHSAATGYYLYYKKTTDSSYTKFPTLISSTAASGSYINGTVTGLDGDVDYTFKVSAVNSAGESGQSSQPNTIKPLQVPPVAPTSLNASTGDGHVTLSWTAPSGAVTGYKIYRTTTSNAGYTLVNYAYDSSGNGSIVPVTGNSYTDNSALSIGTTYYYAVAAYNSGGDSSRSSEVAIAPIVSCNVSVSPVSSAQTKVTVNGRDYWIRLDDVKAELWDAGAITSTTNYTYTYPFGGTPVAASNILQYKIRESGFYKLFIKVSQTVANGIINGNKATSPVSYDPLYSDRRVSP